MINKALLSFGSLLLLTLTWQIFSQSPPGQFYQAPLSEAVPVETSIAHYQATFASHESTPEVHSATAIELANNDIMAFWYGGTREGHKDVMIYQNTWDNKTKQWGQEKGLISRVLTKKNTSRYIRKLGNPVVTRGADNSIWLFYVSVSVGGWAGSSINLTRSYDEGKTWSTSQRLITSPFLNLSTLIKGTPIHYTDGSTGLPVYHELIGKFGELLILNSNGEVTNKIRLSWGKTSLQPILFTTSANDAVAMMRYQGEAPNRILTQTSNNAGLSWTPVKKSLLPNPGAGIIGLKLKETGKLLLAFNNDEEEREDMSLAMSSNQGKTWQLSRVVEENHLEAPDKDQQFAYPWLLQTENGTIHLLYTWHKSHIKHVTFNEAWLNSGSTKRRGTNHEP